MCRLFSHCWPVQAGTMWQRRRPLFPLSVCKSAQMCQMCRHSARLHIITGSVENVFESSARHGTSWKKTGVAISCRNHLKIFPLRDLTAMAFLRPIYPHSLTKPRSILLFNRVSLLRPRQCRFLRHVFEGPQLQQHQPRSADGAAAENRGEHREDKGEANARPPPPTQGW